MGSFFSFTSYDSYVRDHGGSILSRVIPNLSDHERQAYDIFKELLCSQIDFQNLTKKLGLGVKFGFLRSDSIPL